MVTHTHTHTHTQCDPSEATWQLINSIVLEDQGRNVTKIMFFGGGCSLATEPLAALAGRFYKIPMVSHIRIVNTLCVLRIFSCTHSVT